MNKVKKSLALAMSALLATTLLSVSAFAADGDTANVSIKGDNTVSGKEYTLSLEVNGTGVGGVQGTVAYDKAAFTLKEIAVDANIADDNKFAEEDVNKDAFNQADGSVKFVLLADADGYNGKYVDFKFTVNDGVKTANAFTLSDVVVSDKAGSAKIDNAADAAVSKEVAFKTVDTAAEEVFKSDGATIKTDASEYKIRFETNVADFSNVDKVGFVYYPSVLLNGQELTKDLTVNNIAAKVEEVKIGDNGYNDKDSVFHLVLDTNARINREYAVRGYIVTKDGNTLYAGNTVTDGANVTDGTMYNSLVSVAKAIAAEYGVTLDGEITADNYSSIIEELVKHIK